MIGIGIEKHIKKKNKNMEKTLGTNQKNRITTHLPKQAWRYIIGIPLILLSLGGFFYTKLDY